MLKFKNLAASLGAALILTTSYLPVYANTNEFIDVSQASTGLVKVNYTAQTNARLKLLIEKDGERKSYDISPNKLESFPLTFDSGNYKIRIMENTTGNSYKALYSKDVNVSLASSQSVFLASTQTINWTPEMAPIKKAAELTKNLNSDQEKVMAIYNYVINNYKYDYQKAASVKPGYVPNIIDTYNSNTGICYDYSTLFAAMLRSQGIPTKVVKGYTSYVDEYHAWNEVLINGNWVTVDTTFDAAYSQSGKNVQFAKPSNEYKTTAEV